jgi:hypothetical protein
MAIMKYYTVSTAPDESSADGMYFVSKPENANLYDTYLVEAGIVKKQDTNEDIANNIADLVDSYLQEAEFTLDVVSI